MWYNIYENNEQCVYNKRQIELLADRFDVYCTHRANARERGKRSFPSGHCGQSGCHACMSRHLTSIPIETSVEMVLLNAMIFSKESAYVKGDY